ncbi:hypothetical protein OF83DRAFT_311254 [Amylostereum chailletii]|nr:hypothetical protein OF83DRAFT_311254 [Amylostereum chailletii]
MSEYSNKSSIHDEPWRTYGLREPVVAEFLSKHMHMSLVVTTVDIAPDGSMRKEHSITENVALWDFLNSKPPSQVALRVLLVKELSAEALQILSTALGIHLGFWAWVASDQASDGFWLNTHNDGKILSFDLPCFEFYSADKSPPARVVREGRLKQLSSRHRLFGNGSSLGNGPVGYDAYINRRVTSYLVPMDGMHTFLFFSEDCQFASSFPLHKTVHSDPISTEWLLHELKQTDPALRAQYTEEPIGLILAIVTKLLKTWHVFTVHIQRDLENIDGTLPESLPIELPERNLYDVGNYLHRDIVQTLFRFTQQLGKYDGYLKYLCNGTKERFRPRKFMHDVGNLNNNVTDLRRRMDVSMERGNMSLTLINNYIALQQARLASEQARISVYMAQVQRQNSQSSRRLSVVATIFLPLSFATVRPPCPSFSSPTLAHPGIGYSHG